MKVYILQENFFEFVVDDYSDGHSDKVERRRNVIGIFATMDDLLKRMAEEIMMARGEDSDLAGNDSITGYEVSVGDTDTHDIENIGYYSYINDLNSELSKYYANKFFERMKAKEQPEHVETLQVSFVDEGRMKHWREKCCGQCKFRAVEYNGKEYTCSFSQCSDEEVLKFDEHNGCQGIRQYLMRGIFPEYAKETKEQKSEDTERKHPIQRAAENASFDILGFIREKYKKAVTKHIKS